MLKHTAALAAVLGIGSALGACNLVSGVDGYSLTGGSGGSSTTSSKSSGGATSSTSGSSTGTGTIPDPGSGKTLWSRGYGSSGKDGVSAVAVDASDRAVLAGFLSGATDFHDTMSSAMTGVFVARVDAAGKTTDLATFPTLVADPNKQPALALRSDGGAVIAGALGGDVDFGAGLLQGSSPRLFVAALDPANKAKWSFSIGNNANVETPHLTVDADDNTFLFFDSKSGKIAIGGQQYPTNDINAAYLVKIDPNGMPSWSRQFVNNQFVYAYSISVDPSDGKSVYVAGKADTGPLDCGCPGGALAMQGYGMYVAKYDSAGKCVRQFSYGYDTPPHAVVADSKGNVYLTGAHEVPFDIEGTSLGHADGSFNFDGYVIKLNAAGKLAWARSFGAAGVHDDTDELVVDESGDVFVTGHIGGTVDFGNGVKLTAQTKSDLFITRLQGADGKTLWARRFVNVTDENVLYAHVARDGAGNVLVGGLFLTTIDFEDIDSPHPAKGNLDGYLAKLAAK